jgi:DNA polymerase-3 subunit alpha
MISGFVHLRVHTAYSLSESTLRIKKLAELAQQDHQPALAMTDSFNLFGGYEFSKTMSQSGIQPIIGVSVSLSDAQGVGNVALLAMSETGYQNLSHLVSDALMEAESGMAPSISLGQLSSKATDLILLSGGALDGFIAGPAARHQPDLAKSRAASLFELFGDRLYIELQRHGLEAEIIAEPLLLEIADATGCPLVATNDCHFETAEMHIPQSVLCCIAQSERLAAAEKLVHTPHHRFKTAAQMTEIFADIPESIENTLHIARRCAVRVEDRDPILPPFAGEAGRSTEEELRFQAEGGLKRRLAEVAAAPDYSEQAYRDRLDYELGVINAMGFAGYFLIVADFIGWAKDRDIPVGPGRGSGAGSVVAWALRITDLDPLRWGLLFERFLNPERVSMPDFDIDFCQDRREEVISFVQQKYGRDKVAQIITFGTLQARAAIRDVGRVLDMPYGQVDRIAKMIPQNPANPVSISQALESEPELKTLYREDEQVGQLVDTALRLEGLYRHTSTHAAGLVIGDRPLPDLVPIYRDPRSDMPVTQFNMKHVEQVGLVKFDFLGLKTLTVIQKAVDLLAEQGQQIDMDRIPLDDAKTYEMLAGGDTVGVFQLESSGMREVLRGLKPDRFEDIIAVVALYRPGPMDNIPTYIARKHGREAVSYMHPGLEPILAETYGIMIYQEQVQQAARDLAGYTLGGADILRRAMGKKIKAEMDAQRATFVEGAAGNQINGQLASDIFDQIAAFAGYGFNKSHAAAYALVSYQTAWLKANHPVEFMAASMSLDAGNTDKLAQFVQDCKAHSIPVLPPCVNQSGPSFGVQQTGGPEGQPAMAVRYALGAIRNVGAEAMRGLCLARQEGQPFQDLDDFASRLPKEVANKRQMENLIKAGALDCLEGNRRKLHDQLDRILGHADMLRREAASDQTSLFGEAEDSAVNKLTLDDLPDWGKLDRLGQEREALGLHLSAHPMDDYLSQLERLGVVPSAALTEALGGREQKRLKLAGQVSQISERISQRGNRYAFVQFTDRTGSFEVTFFAEPLLQYKPLLASEAILLISVDARLENDAVRLQAVRVEALDAAVASYHGGLGVWLDNPACLTDLKKALTEDGGGKADLKLFVRDKGRDIEISMPNRFRLSGELRQQLHKMPGILMTRDL